MEEAGHLTSQADGAKRLYSITPQGSTHLEENRDFVDAVLGRLAAVGERISRMRGREDDARPDWGTPLLRAALDNLRDAALKRLADDPAAEPKVVELLARAAGEMKGA